ncbi:MAG: putative Ig domain-containing protein [Chloroflexota bacterium]
MRIIKSLAFIAFFISITIGAGLVRAELINTQISSHAIKGDFLISPDEKTIVYESSSDRLYSASIEGDNVTEISNVTGFGLIPGNIDGFDLTPDGSRVVFKHLTVGGTDLYSVHTLGGEAIKLNSELVAGGHVFQFQISPDGTHVLYLADQEIDGLHELYIVPILGGDPIKLNHPLKAIGSNHNEFDNLRKQQFSPDGKMVLFVVQSFTDQTHDLFSVPAAGGEVTKLNQPILSTVKASGIARDFAISPDSQQVVYMLDQETADQDELYQVPIHGGEQIKLNGPLPENGDVFWASYTADGKYILYVASLESKTDHVIYSKSVETGITTQLSSPTTRLVDIPEVVGSGERIIYRGYDTESEYYTLFSTPLTYMDQIQLTPDSYSEWDDYSQKSLFGYQISEDGNTVVFHSDHQVEGIFELYRVPVTGGQLTKLNQLLEEGGDVTTEQARPWHYLISPDDKRVIYLADPEADGVFDLFSTPLAGGPATKLNGTLIPGDPDEDSISSFKFTPDGKQVVYVADQEHEDHIYASILTPIFTSLPAQVALLDLPYSYTIAAEDVEASATLKITADGLPSWLTLTDNGNGTAKLEGSPSSAELGSHQITIQVSNNNGRVDAQVFTLEVKEVSATVFLPLITNP